MTRDETTFNAATLTANERRIMAFVLRIMKYSVHQSNRLSDINEMLLEKMSETKDPRLEEAVEKTTEYLLKDSELLDEISEYLSLHFLEDDE